MLSNHRFVLRAFSVAAFGAVALVGSSAFAADDTTPTPAPSDSAATTTPPNGAQIDVVGNSKDSPDKAKDPNEKDLKHVSLELNPLGVLIGRYSVQLELMPFRHSAFVLNPHFDHVSADVTSSGGGVSATYSESFTGFGGELGYRYYTNPNGPAGFYFGPSVLLGTYSASATGANSVSFQSIGGAIDIGGQAVVGPGIVIGGGFGLQYTAVNKDFADLPLTASLLAGGGVRPRFLLSVGYAL